MVIWLYSYMDGWVGGWKPEGKKNGWTDKLERQTDGWMDGPMNGWME